MSSSSRYVADFNVAGMRYWDGAKVISKLKPGKRLRLVAEPHNPADPNAVAIYRKDVKLGYIPRDQNDLAAQLLRFGHDDVLECRILKVDKKAETWNQVCRALHDRQGERGIAQARRAVRERVFGGFEGSRRHACLWFSRDDHLDCVDGAL